MERRDVLKVGLAGLAATGAGCAAPLANAAQAQPSFGDRELAEFMDRMDRGRERIRCSPLWDGVGPQAEPMARKALDALLVTGMFGDLPEPARAHPAIQARMWSAVPQMDEAVLGMAAYLDRNAPAAEEIQRALRENPDLADRLGEWMEREESWHGISIDRRIQVRSAVKQVAWRLETQPQVLIGDSVARVRKAVERYGATAPARAAYEESFGGGCADGAQDVVQRRTSTAGGIILGIGVAAGVISLLTSSTLGIYLITPAVILTVVGLILMGIAAARGAQP